MRFSVPKTARRADTQAIEFSALVSEVPHLPKRLGSGMRIPVSKLPVIRPGNDRADP